MRQLPFTGPFFTVHFAYTHTTASHSLKSDQIVVEDLVVN